MSMVNTKTLYSSFTFGDQVVFYLLDEKSQMMGMTVLPVSVQDQFTVEGRWNIESLVQLKFIGDAYPAAYSQGRTMHNSGSSADLKFVRQDVETEKGETRVVTTLQSARVTAVHTLRAMEGMPYLTIETVIKNTSGETQKLEMLSSFNVCDLSAAESDERMADLNFYRLQSRWSGEGKLLRQRLTDLHMEPSWSLHGVNVIRYGQVGSMPVRGFFPWGVLEDTRYGFCLGAQLYYAGSWQMELYDKDKKVSFSGGLADREFGHFLKTMRPGEILEAPKAVIAVCVGDVEEVSWRLTKAQEEAMADLPESEKDLPLIFNEYCTTWGDPSEENIRKIVDKIKDRGFRYLVIDCGWYGALNSAWYNCQGDWEYGKDRFPGGLKKTADRIRDAGMIPGLWFEMEVAGAGSRASREQTDLLLKRDGLPLEDSGNRFWDMRNPKAIEYLDEHVIGTLRDNGFGYLKVDYNGLIGIGPDGEDGFGEEVRKCVLGSRAYFRRIREKIPGIVIENCSSGGHRLEPSMMAVSSMASFSDAHECIQIPIIAANLHRAILPRQSQIWAVLRGTDSFRRLYYSMVNGFLGRLCVSGDVYNLDDAQWKVVDEGLRFYPQCAAVIKSGKSVLTRDENMDYSHPVGYQAVMREGTEDAQGLALAVIHRFQGEAAEKFTVALPDGKWRIRGTYGEPEITCALDENGLTVQGMGELSGIVALLEKV